MLSGLLPELQIVNSMGNTQILKNVMTLYADIHLLKLGNMTPLVKLIHDLLKNGNAAFAAKLLILSLPGTRPALQSKRNLRWRSLSNGGGKCLTNFV